MSDVRNEDEIDLVQVVAKLWKGKWLIFAFMLAFSALGIAYVENSESKYESQVSFQLHLSPPGYSAEKVLREFTSAFQSREVFRRWTDEISPRNLSYENLTDTKKINAVVLAKRENERLVSFSDDGDIIFIASSDLEVLDDLHSYLVFVNNTVTQMYAARIESDYEIIKRDLIGLISYFDIAVDELLDMPRFLADIDSEAAIYKIGRPSEPALSSSSNTLSLSLFTLCGVFLGAFVVVIRSSFEANRNAN